MLNRVLLLRNIGKFDSVTAADIPFAQMTLVYAENGRGKSTLTAILRSLATGDPLTIAARHRLGAPNPPHVVIDDGYGPPPAIFENDAWNRTISNLAIFDETFVQENVSSGLVVESEHRKNLHELILGSQGVALNRSLQDVVERIENLNRSLRERAEAIPLGARFGLNVDDFCALPARDEVDTAIRDAERSLAAANEEDRVRTTAEFDEFGLPTIDVPALVSLLARDLPELDRAATAHVQSHISTLGEGGEDWVASGINRVQGGIVEIIGKPCPFCTQDLAGSEIIAHYRSYFADEYAALKREVHGTIRTVGDFHGRDAVSAFERSIRHASERYQFWSRFVEFPEVSFDTALIEQVWRRTYDAVIASLSSKQNAPLEPVQLPESTYTVIGEFERLREQVFDLSAQFQQANNAIRLVKEQAAAGNSALLEADLARLMATKSRHTAEVVALCDAYLSVQAAKAEAERERDEARAALDEYRRDIFPAYEAAINEYLGIFNAAFRLDRVVSQNIRGGSACTYNVLINNRPIAVSGAAPQPGTPSFRTSLSAGDRNALALAFFFASLDRDVNLAGKIVVIDDPISSLDEQRSLTTVQQIRRLTRRTGQVVVLSHRKPFLCDIWDQTDQTQRAAVEIVRDGDGSTIREWDVTRDMITLHDRRHKSLRDYLDAAPVDHTQVARDLRLVLEAFLRVAYPEQFPPGMMLGPFLGICEQRVGTPQEILSRVDIDELRDLTEYANRFHHNGNPAREAQHINDAELLNFVRRTLAFTRR